MKSITYLTLAACSLALPVAAQSAATPPATAAPGASGSPERYSVAARGADYRVWQRTEWEPTPSGRSIPHVRSYVEIETGMHHWQDGQWLESHPEIQCVENGAAAQRAAHRAGFALNVNSPVSVQVLTPDQKQLKIRPVGLAYYDFHLRKHAWIAELKDSEGWLVGTNQVLYPDAFAGAGIQADVRYTYRKAGLEQDIILRKRPPLPEAFGFNPTTTWLLVYSEVVDPPPDVRVQRNIRRGWKKSTVDTVIDFGTMRAVQGTAFDLGGAENRRKGIPVAKHWRVIDGRSFIIEEVSFARIAPRLRNLQAATQPNARTDTLLASTAPASKLRLPAAPAARLPSTRSIQLAAAAPDTSGFVVDLDLESGSDLRLEGDKTYVVRGTVNLNNVVIEGGTCLKYDRDACINIFGPVQCLTRPYSPAVFTAIDDDSVGETLEESTGQPSGWYAGCALALWEAADLKYLNVRYAYGGIYFCNGNFSLSHSQFGSCYSALLYETAYFTNCNLLIQRVEVPFNLDYSHGRVEHLTCDQARVLTDDFYFTYQWWCDENPGSSSLALVNSLTSSITNGYGNISVTTDHVNNYSSGAGVYQTVGAGAYYLIGGSTNRNAGATNVQSALAAAFRSKTTYPPILYSNVTVSTATTFSPQAQRDSDALDLGWHYDPLDYTFGGVTANASLTFTPGTAVGWFRTSSGWYHAGHGIRAADNVTVTFDGTLAQRTYWARCNTVQEQPAYAGYGPGGITGWTYPDTNAAPKVIARFTCCAMMNSDQNFFRDDWGMLKLQAANCEFLVGGVAGYNALYSITNCLFERSPIWLMTGESFPYMILRNCTIHGSSLGFAHWEPGPARFFTSIRDTIFDGTIVDTGYPSLPSCVDYNYNAYLNGADRLYPQGANDVLLADYNWQASWLGNYYLPTNSPLINTGSVANAASIGLYHYTTQTNQAKETNSVVDIGYHYVAVNSSGSPIDTDGDGSPDYYEDVNGDGSATGDPTSWLSYDSANGLSGASGLQVFTPLK